MKNLKHILTKNMKNVSYARIKNINGYITKIIILLKYISINPITVVQIKIVD